MHSRATRTLHIHKSTKHICLVNLPFMFFFTYILYYSYIFYKLIVSIIYYQRMTIISMVNNMDIHKDTQLKILLFQNNHNWKPLLIHYGVFLASLIYSWSFFQIIFSMQLSCHIHPQILAIPHFQILILKYHFNYPYNS